jgi:hypothetical protein
MWLTLALLVSIAANVFFGWIAWDTHQRYQELAEQLHAAENHLVPDSVRPPNRPTMSSPNRSGDTVGVAEACEAPRSQPVGS